MRTVTKKVLSLMHIFVTVTILLAGCAGIGQTGKDYALNDGSAGEYAITKAPTELTLFMVRGDGEKTEDLAVWKEVAKVTNVSLKTTISTSISDANQMLSIMLASGELPDIIVYASIKDFAEEYGMEGAFARLDELVSDKTPNLKAQFDRVEVKNFITATDGHIYYLPKILPDGIPANGWFIRQDWLDKLGLNMPTNIDEYYEVLKAFRDHDPNGNGIKDEVPFLHRFKSIDGLLEMQNIPAAWDVKDGKVYYSPATQKFKDGMSLIAKWYAENLIDKEIYTRGSKSREKLFGENLGGSTHDYFGTTAQFNDILKESVPGFKVVAIPPPGGKEYSARAIVHIGGAAISAASEKQEVAIRFLDFLYSDIGSRYMNFGIEGEQYDIKEGKPYYNDSILRGNDTAINELAKIGAASDFPFVQDFWYEEQWLTEEALKGFELYNQNKYSVAQFPTLSYTKEEKDRFTQLNTAISTYISEYKQKWVLGSEDINATFDKYMSYLEKMGVRELEQIQQEAYDRFLNAINTSE